MGDHYNVRAVLWPLMQTFLELFQSKHTKTEHLPLRRLVAALGLLTESLKDVAEGNAESNTAHQLLLNELAEEDACDSQFLLRILWEETVLIKEVVDHAGKDIILSRIARGLEFLEHLNNLVESLLRSVDLLEVLVCMLLDVLGGTLDLDPFVSRGTNTRQAVLQRWMGIQAGINQCLGAVANLDADRRSAISTRGDWNVLLEDGIVKSLQELQRLGQVLQTNERGLHGLSCPHTRPHGLISLAQVGDQSDEEQCRSLASVGRRSVLEVFLELEQVVVGHDESECDAKLVVLVPIQNHSARLIGGRQLLHHILDDVDDGGVAGRLPLRGCAPPSLGAGSVDRRRRNRPKPIDRGRAMLDGHFGVGLEERRDELAH